MLKKKAKQDTLESLDIVTKREGLCLENDGQNQLLIITKENIIKCKEYKAQTSITFSLN